MAIIRHDVPGSGYGNIYTDPLIWGGSAWSMANGTIKVYLGEAEDYYEALGTHGESEIVNENTLFDYWTEAEALVFKEVLDLYESVCGLKFEAVSKDEVAQANIIWWKTDLGTDTAGYHETPAFDQGNS